MGVTKAFIKNPETVRLLSECSACNTSFLHYSSLHWKRCVTDTGTIWQHEYSVLGGITCATSTNAPGAYNGSGKTIRKELRMPKSVTTVTRFSLVGKSAGALVCLVIADLWVIISMLTGKVLLEKNWHLFAVLEVGAYYLLYLSHSDPLKAEPVAFSGRIQLLVSKLGRSSKPSPRFILVVSLPCLTISFANQVMQTKKAVHIVVANNKDGAPQMSLERKIPLVSIKTIGMSNLRDDWMVGYVSLSSKLPYYPPLDTKWQRVRGGRPCFQLLLQD
jgi:Unconventional myosin tail, actin- and lipid-binding